MANGTVTYNGETLPGVKSVSQREEQIPNGIRYIIDIVFEDGGDKSSDGEPDSSQPQKSSLWPISDELRAKCHAILEEEKARKQRRRQSRR